MGLIDELHTSAHADDVDRHLAMGSDLRPFHLFQQEPGDLWSALHRPQGQIGDPVGVGLSEDDGGA